VAEVSLSKPARFPCTENRRTSRSSQRLDRVVVAFSPYELGVAQLVGRRGHNAAKLCNTCFFSAPPSILCGASISVRPPSVLAKKESTAENGRGRRDNFRSPPDMIFRKLSGAPTRPVERTAASRLASLSSGFSNAIGRAERTSSAAVAHFCR
jgi:hypothetical protein